MSKSSDNWLAVFCGVVVTVLFLVASWVYFDYFAPADLSPSRESGVFREAPR